MPQRELKYCFVDDDLIMRSKTSKDVPQESMAKYLFRQLDRHAEREIFVRKYFPHLQSDWTIVLMVKL